MGPVAVPFPQVGPCPPETQGSVGSTPEAHGKLSSGGRKRKGKYQVLVLVLKVLVLGAKYLVLLGVNVRRHWLTPGDLDDP